MDRGVVTGMVEDYWRAVIPASQSDPSAAIGVTKKFEERVEETARLLQPVEAAAFRQAVDAERERLLQEYQANPAALKRRLGVPLGVDAAPPSRHSGGLGELAVRTAVRATVWESIWALFRAFRR